jgi:hypothetical protein
MMLTGDMSFESDWTALRNADAATSAPLRIAAAVMVAWDAAPSPAVALRPWWRGPFALVAAAAVILIAASVVWLAVSREDSPASAEQPLLTLSADPLFDTESLHIVRVRMPRGALRALGVALVEPEAGGLVDVDVVVGDDGLPREIRRVAGVREAMEGQVR